MANIPRNNPALYLDWELLLEIEGADRERMVEAVDRSPAPGTLSTTPLTCSSVWQRANTSATSCAVWYLCSRSFSRRRKTMALSQSGVPGRTSANGRGVSSHTRFSTATVFAARKGGRPLVIWYSTLPRLNRSAR